MEQPAEDDRGRDLLQLFLKDLRGWTDEALQNDSIFKCFSQEGGLLSE